MADFNVWGYLARLGTRVLSPGDPTLQAGNEVCAINEPILLVLEDVEEFLHQEYQEFQCNAPGCRLTFNQVYESEAHYRAVHTNSCSVCRKSLPSNHLLDLHIQESHDSFFSAMAEKKASYECFLPTCNIKFWTPQERRDHAITSHDFPPDFRFDATKPAPSKKTNKRQKARSASMKESKMDVDNNGESCLTNTKKDVKHLSLKSESEQVSSVMEVDGETPTVVMRKNKNEASRPSSGRRPISLARLPSPKLDTPQILNRRPSSSSVSGRRNTISSPRSPVKETNGNGMIIKEPLSPRFNIETAVNANVPTLKIDSEGNSRSRRCTISSPRSYGNLAAPKSLSTSPRPMSINNISIDSDSASNSPRKSKIPVLRSNSSKAPKQFSFGVGIAKAFNRGKGKAWYQGKSQSSQQVNIEKSDFTSLLESLPNVKS